MAILEYNVDSFFDDIFNRFIKKISEFVYDDELLFSVEGVEGYVWATDDLVYTEKDFFEKQRVLKPGCFLVEFLPEENGENYQYLYQVKEYARKAGLDYYAKVAWKKGDFVANTGRKSKNTEDVCFFTK